MWLFVESHTIDDLPRVGDGIAVCAVETAVVVGVVAFGSAIVVDRLCRFCSVDHARIAY